MRAEWERMAREGATEAELAAAKRYLTGAYPLRFIGNGAISGQLLGVADREAAARLCEHPQRSGRGGDATISAASPGGCLRPDQLTMVIVGRPEGVAATN